MDQSGYGKTDGRASLATCVHEQPQRSIQSSASCSSVNRKNKPGKHIDWPNGLKAEPGIFQDRLNTLTDQILGEQPVDTSWSWDNFRSARRWTTRAGPSAFTSPAPPSPPGTLPSASGWPRRSALAQRRSSSASPSSLVFQWLSSLPPSAFVGQHRCDAGRRRSSHALASQYQRRRESRHCRPVPV